MPLNVLEEVRELRAGLGHDNVPEIFKIANSSVYHRIVDLEYFHSHKDLTDVPSGKRKHRTYYDFGVAVRKMWTDAAEVATTGRRSACFKPWREGNTFTTTWNNLMALTNCSRKQIKTILRRAEDMTLITRYSPSKTWGAGRSSHSRYLHITFNAADTFEKFIEMEMYRESFNIKANQDEIKDFGNVRDIETNREEGVVNTVENTQNFEKNREEGVVNTVENTQNFEKNREENNDVENSHKGLQSSVLNTTLASAEHDNFINENNDFAGNKNNSKSAESLVPPQTQSTLPQAVDFLEGAGKKTGKFFKKSKMAYIKTPVKLTFNPEDGYYRKDWNECVQLIKEKLEIADILTLPQCKKIRRLIDYKKLEKMNLTRLHDFFRLQDRYCCMSDIPFAFRKKTLKQLLNQWPLIARRINAELHLDAYSAAMGELNMKNNSPVHLNVDIQTYEDLGHDKFMTVYGTLPVGYADLLSILSGIKNKTITNVFSCGAEVFNRARLFVKYNSDKFFALNSAFPQIINYFFPDKSLFRDFVKRTQSFFDRLQQLIIAGQIYGADKIYEEMQAEAV